MHSHTMQTKVCLKADEKHVHHAPRHDHYESYPPGSWRMVPHDPGQSFYDYYHDLRYD